MTRPGLSWLLVPLVLSGCASISKERGHAEVAQLVEERTGRKTHWEQGTPEDEKVRAHVEALLRGGLTRERAVEIALLNNPALQETYEELGVAQAEMVEAGLLENPTLDGSVGFPAIGGRVEYEASIVQNFLGIFLLPLRKKVAGEQFAADVLRVAHEALETVGKVKKAFVSVQTQQQLVELRRMTLTAEGAAAELSQRLFEAGNITELDLATEQAAFEQARLELSEAELHLAQEREALNQLLGLWGPRTEWTLAEKLPELPEDEPSLEHVESRAIRHRLDVDAARKQALLLQNAVGLARSSRLFGLVEVGVHTHQDPDGPRLYGPTLSLELPLFHQRQPLIARLEAQQRQAQRRLEALSVNTRSQVRLHRAQLLTAREKVDHFRRVLMPLRDKVVAHAQLQYNGMQLGLPELLQAKQQQLQSYSDYLSTLREYWDARVELELAMGGSLGAPPSPTVQREER